MNTDAHRLVFPPRYTYEKLDAVLARLSAYYCGRAPGPFAVLVDLSAVEHSEARNRARIAAALAVVSDVFTRDCVGHAFVVRGSVMRGALTALFWLRHPAWPVRVFVSPIDAERWLRDQLTRRG